MLKRHWIPKIIMTLNSFYLWTFWSAWNYTNQIKYLSYKFVDLIVFNFREMFDDALKILTDERYLTRTNQTIRISAIYSS